MKWLHICLTPLLLLAGVDANAADARLWTRAQVEYAQFSPVNDNGDVTHFGEGSASAALSGPGLDGNADARAFFGSLEISGAATSMNNGASILAVAQGLWQDVLHFQIFPEFPTSGTAPGFVASVTVTGHGDLFGAINVPGFNPVDIRGPGTYDFSGLIMGPVPIEIALGGQALASRQQQASFAASLHWNGIERVFLPKSSESPRFSVTSASGFDYALAAPVPEPSSLLMGVAALTALLLRCRGSATSAASRHADRRERRSPGSREPGSPVPG